MKKRENQVGEDRQKIVNSLKLILNQKGIRYRDLSKALKLSEISIKKMFSEYRFDLDRIEKICEFIGISMLELMRVASDEWTFDHTYTAEQDLLLGKTHPEFFYIFVRLMVGFTSKEIQVDLNISDQNYLKALLALDKANLISLHPANKAVVKVRGPFKLRPDGHMERLIVECKELTLNFFLKNVKSKSEKVFIHTREFYLTKEVFENYCKDLQLLSYEYRKKNTTLFLRKNGEELRPISSVLCVGEFDTLRQIYQRYK